MVGMRGKPFGLSWLGPNGHGKPRGTAAHADHNDDARGPSTTGPTRPLPWGPLVVLDHQIRTGGYFLHEHPLTAKTWKRPPIQSLLRRHGVLAMRCVQCQLGAVNKAGTKWTDSVGHAAPVLKPTRFMSNAVPILRRLHHLCTGYRSHQPLFGGRAEGMAFYSLSCVESNSGGHG